MPFKMQLKFVIYYVKVAFNSALNLAEIGKSRTKFSVKFENLLLNLVKLNCAVLRWIELKFYFKFN